MRGEQARVDGAAANQPAPRKSVFLSHSSADADLAQRICARLEASGITCWIAPRDVTPGEPWALDCLKGVALSNALVLLATEKALGSNQVLSEIEQAHKRRLPIYTVLVPPAKIYGEADFYLSRLHWLQAGARTAEDLADTLASVINSRDGRQAAWEDVSSPPSLSRTMRYRPVAFLKLLAATMLSVVVVIGGAYFTVNRMLDQDFRRIGYVSLSAEPAPDGLGSLVHAQVWLLARDVAFRDVQLKYATQTPGGTPQQRKAGNWSLPEQVGEMQEQSIPLNAGITRLTTCLTVPSPGLRAPYRVTQQFALARNGDSTNIAEIADKAVAREDGSPCGPNPNHSGSYRAGSKL